MVYFDGVTYQHLYFPPGRETMDIYKVTNIHMAKGQDKRKEKKKPKKEAPKK